MSFHMPRSPFLGSKGEDDKIVANVKLSFTPDDDSPSDPILFLREAIRGGGNSSSPQRSEVPGILHGEKVKLVNATLLTGKFTKAIIIILITPIIGNHHLRYHCHHYSIW